jgi:16S rRNA (uracil1498-N3)-methyltransferase
VVPQVKLEGRVERWRRIAREASKVARRVRPLVVGEPMEWPPGMHELSRQELNIVLWEEECLQDLADVMPVETPYTIGIIVGPEGGFSSVEVEMLEELGCVKESMGDLILRAETAGSYAATLVRYHYGLLKPESVSK